MCYNFKALLLRNYQTFLFISNNQTLLDIHDYHTNICASKEVLYKLLFIPPWCKVSFRFLSWRDSM